MSFVFWTGCTSEETEELGPDIVTLDEYRTFISHEENLITVPNFIRFDNSSNLFVYDAANGSVLMLNPAGEIVREFGRVGRGPGEIQWVSHIHLTENYLYIVDTGQFLIHRYLKDGEYDSVFNYGEIGYIPSVPSPPVTTSQIIVPTLTNQPHITADDEVLLSPVQAGASAESVYRLYDWSGEFKADVGEIPEGSAFTLDNEEIRNDILNGEIPGFYRANVFPVSNPSNPDQLKLVYASLPRIAQYRMNGEKLWETDLSKIPEFEKMTDHFFQTMERMQRADIRSRIGLDYFNAGVMGPDGDLFLASEHEMIQIYRFNGEGELTHTYRLDSDQEIELKPIFDIDFSNREIYIVTELGDLRAYPF
ncbi:hypothetical protein DYD21_11275 [Rhodohalobacter sp. SW132]|uniref:6-bladed beta-propeller n=1 Tax=Rhodohalobacter sp. SW132 TaxID=2293433 RepID=UPI000E2872C9|nr:6-bladed beta-propeller [Rhodohalobacter sp. SW132]REL33353.1 hypothetical protein DYD21_11275 [Rhodohalobacter sp. SW132]